MSKEIDPWKCFEVILEQLADNEVPRSVIRTNVETFLEYKKRKTNILKKAEKLNAKYPYETNYGWFNKETHKEIKEMEKELKTVLDNDNPFWSRWIGTFLQIKYKDLK